MNAHHKVYQFLEVVCGRFSDGVDVINEPGHAEAVQFFVKEVNSELTYNWK